MADGAHQEKPISLFYSYSHGDEDLRKKLEDHLAGLRWSEKIAEWHDRNIDVGDEWAKEIDRNLTSADVILLLVSASFIASKYCWSIEMKKALERHDKGEAKVIPVILRPCSWHTTPFAKLQAAPTDAKPVTSWSDPDEALYDVACKIERAVTDLQQRRRRAAEQAQQHMQEARKRQAAEEQKQDALRRREQDEARRAADAEARREPNRAKAIKDFAVFRDIDAPWCPEMVALPVGQFLMGSPEDEEGRSSDEGPQHRVIIGYRLAIGLYPVMFDEYDHFCADTKREKPEDANWGRGRRPVINISWRDAQAYVDWLAKKTSQPYRLPSEAEWEYACRAGTATPFSFGATISTDQANYNGNYTYGKGTKGEYQERTTKVGSFPPNPWGLYDMHGNVWEWVEDVWHESYEGAPADGAAWTDGGGKQSSHLRVYRGGSWNNNPRGLRSAFRFRESPVYRCIDLGFRVVRRQMI
jgi:formylglycine-generating enzyme required for sulfatase activity